MEEMVWTMYHQQRLQRNGMFRRRVAVLCKEGRVEGAVLVGRMWMIPKDAKKPEDPRRVQSIGC